MKRDAAAIAVALSMGASTPIVAEGINGASLAGLTRLGAVIVTVSDGTASESEVRQAVKRRLAQARIAVEAGSGPELLISVSAERDKAEARSCEHGTFRIAVSLRESVTLDRAPDQGLISAITWRTGGSIRRFSTNAPRLGIMDTLQEALSDFVGAVASDSQQAGHTGGEP